MKNKAGKILFGLIMVLSIVGLILIVVKDMLPRKEAEKPISDDLRQTVLRELGTQELAGADSNPEVEDYFKALGYNTLKDDTPWCGAFVCYVLKVNGYDIPTQPLRAKAYENAKGLDLQFNTKVASKTQGVIPYHTVMVGWRESQASGKGHVAFIVEDLGDKFRVAGGNQSNEVNDTYEFPKGRVTRVFNPIKDNLS
jgi:uncharacterized protein (TIGR02594 family)